MQTLLINGSPHSEGDTVALVRAMKEALRGDVVQFDCYKAKLSPCIDCRRCHRVAGCALDDDMQRVYALIAESDALVIASPVYFCLPTPPVIALGSRLETYWCAGFRGEAFMKRTKRGGVILVGGGSGGMDFAESASKRYLRAAGVASFGPTVISAHTDELPAARDEEALRQAALLAEFLNG